MNLRDGLYFPKAQAWVLHVQDSLCTGALTSTWFCSAALSEPGGLDSWFGCCEAGWRRCLVLECCLAQRLLLMDAWQVLFLEWFLLNSKSWAVQHEQNNQ